MPGTRPGMTTAEFASPAACPASHPRLELAPTAVIANHRSWRPERWQSGRMHRTRNALLQVRSSNVLSRKVLVDWHFVRLAPALLPPSTVLYWAVR